jgi:hypothetical protein
LRILYASYLAIAAYISQIMSKANSTHQDVQTWHHHCRNKVHKGNGDLGSRM